MSKFKRKKQDPFPRNSTRISPRFDESGRSL